MKAKQEGPRCESVLHEDRCELIAGHWGKHRSFCDKNGTPQLVSWTDAGLARILREEQEKQEKQEAPTPRSKDGKKLFGTAEALRLARVFSPRISPDGSRAAYLVAENKMEKDKPWKSSTQMWVVPAAGPASAARQYTRGEESVSDIHWSPDGKIVGLLMNAGEDKEKKQQVWFMYIDGGEPWQVTKHKSGVRSFDPTSPAFQAAGAQAVEAVVRVRPLMLAFLDRNVAALSAAWPLNVRFVVPLWAMFAENWIHAAVIVAPGGIVSPAQRMPTV